jgi:hypothetical protein
MKIREEIYHLIRNDIKLRRDIADLLCVTDASVYGHAVRKAPKLKEYSVVRTIMIHTGFKENQIFEEEKKKSLSKNKR